MALAHSRRPSLATLVRKLSSLESSGKKLEYLCQNLVGSCN
ncbi:MAG: hypothetical protein U9P07_05285 [Pseudomonadota bacterium]|nr:hypothetical protein [Pseudomonadota bacterium]